MKIFPFFKKKPFNVLFLRERERERERERQTDRQTWREGGAESEEDRRSKAGSVLTAESPMRGLNS